MTPESVPADERRMVLVVARPSALTRHLTALASTMDARVTVICQRDQVGTICRLEGAWTGALAAHAALISACLTVSEETP